jgi:YbbR domain-containing protein
VLVRSADPAVSDVTAEPPQLYVHLEPVLRRVIPIRVQLSGQVPVGYQLGQPGANPDHLTVTGPASLVDQAVQTLVDVSVQGVTVGVNGISTPLVVDASGTALTTTGLGLTPPAVSVDVPISQLTQHKAVGVQPVTHGAQGPGYVVQPLEVDPATVTLVGSAAGLASVNFVHTQSIDITGIASTVVRQVALAPPSGTLLLQPNQTVNVTIRVTPLTTTQTLRVTPSAINVPSGLVVTNTPVPVALTISGPAPTLATLSSADIRDVTGKGPGQYRISPQVRNLPQGMSLPRTEPGPVEVDLAATPNGAG